MVTTRLRTVLGAGGDEGAPARHGVHEGQVAREHGKRGIKQPRTVCARTEGGTLSEQVLSTSRRDRPDAIWYDRCKVVVTIGGPLTETVEQLEAMLRAGMTVARFDFTAGSRSLDQHLNTLKNLRLAQKNTQCLCAVHCALGGNLFATATKAREDTRLVFVEGQTVRFVHRVSGSSAGEREKSDDTTARMTACLREHRRHPGGRRRGSRKARLPRILSRRRRGARAPFPARGRDLRGARGHRRGRQGGCCLRGAEMAHAVKRLAVDLAQHGRLKTGGEKAAAVGDDANALVSPDERSRTASNPRENIERASSPTRLPRGSRGLPVRLCLRSAAQPRRGADRRWRRRRRRDGRQCCRSPRRVSVARRTRRTYFRARHTALHRSRGRGAAGSARRRRLEIAPRRCSPAEARCFATVIEKIGKSPYRDPPDGLAARAPRPTRAEATDVANIAAGRRGRAAARPGDAGGFGAGVRGDGRRVARRGACTTEAAQAPDAVHGGGGRSPSSTSNRGAADAQSGGRARGAAPGAPSSDALRSSSSSSGRWTPALRGARSDAGRIARASFSGRAPCAAAGVDRRGRAPTRRAHVGAPLGGPIARGDRRARGPKNIDDRRTARPRARSSKTLEAQLSAARQEKDAPTSSRAFPHSATSERRC